MNEPLNYNRQMTAIGAAVADCFHIHGRCATPSDLPLHQLVGVTHGDHVRYMNDNAQVPAVVRSHLDTFMVVPEDALVQLALQRLRTESEHTLTEIAQLCIAQWELATGTRFVRDNPRGTVRFTQEWSPVSATEDLSKLLGRKEGDLLVLNALGDALKSLKTYISTQTNAPSRDVNVAIGKLTYLLGLPAVSTFKADFVSYLSGVALRFRDTLSDAEQNYINKRPTKELYDAERDFSRMKKVSLAKGRAGQQAPVYSKLVYAFSSIESLAMNVMGLPDGFALVALKNSNPADSYFVLVIKNGENVTLISDVPEYSDPLMENRMASRNQRYNVDRHSNSYFPYSFLNLMWEDSDRHVAVDKARTTLVDPKTNIEVIGNFSDLSVKQLLWFGRVIEMGYDRYFLTLTEEKAIGLLTAQTLHIGSKLAEKAASLPACVHHDAIALPGSTELNREALEPHFDDMRTTKRNNQWMEDKFASSIPDEAIYPLLGSEATPLQLTYTGKKGASVAPVLKPDTMTALPVSKLYTQEDALASSLFIGRNNQAKAIQALANADFEARKADMVKWVYTQIIKNIPNLMDSLISLDHSRFYLSRGAGEESHLGGVHEVRQIHFMKNTFSNFVRSKDEVSTLALMLNLCYHKEIQCYIACHMDVDACSDGPDYRFMLNIANVWDLVNVTGIARKDLPVELQTYNLPDGLGNTILDTHDPLDLLKNPWNDLVFTFSLPVSRVLVNKMRKDKGLPAIRGQVANYWECDKLPEAMAMYDYLRARVEAGAIDERGIKLSSVTLRTHKPAFATYLNSEQRKV